MLSGVTQKTLDLYPIDYPFETLYHRIKSDQPKLILDPSFQRKYKWDKGGWGRASRFIESCLMRIPLPSCYFAEIQDGKHIVIDGVQRLTTIVSFMDDGFALEGLTVFKDLEGKLFSQIGEYKSALESTTIRCIVLRKENPQFIIREIFSRLNQGAVELSDQEIRHALYPGEFDDLLTRLASLEQIKNFAKGPSSEVRRDNMEAEEQVLRYFAFSEDLKDYDRLSKFLDGFMESMKDIGKEKAKDLEIDFKNSLDKCIYIFGENAFRDCTKPRTRQSIVYYDLLMHSVRNISLEFVHKHTDNFRKAFDELCKSEDFQKTLSGGTQNRVSIIRRREIWRDLMKNHDLLQ